MLGILSLMECVLDSVAENFKDKINSNDKNTLFRFLVCVVFFLLGITMTTGSGLYIQNLIDNYVTGYPCLICAFLESIGFCN